MQTASNIAASAKSGMDKTNAVVQEKVEKVTTRDPLQKQTAEKKKEAKIQEAERTKLQAQQEAAAKHGHTAGTGATGTRGTGAGTGTTGTHGATGVHDPTHVGALPFH